jgi:uncharacterized membrane protein
MKNVFLTMTVFIFLLFAACSKKTSPGKTAAEPPKAKATTYAVEVLPLIQMRCSPCHLPSKGGNKPNFENYTSAQKFAATMVSRIEMEPDQIGFMPFKQPNKLSAEEIAVFKKWVSDGALEK